MPKSTVCALAVLAVTFFCLGAVSQGATYYVAINGSNSNSGSQQSPWLTIGYAASKAVAGDIVRVQSGTYDERVAISATGTNGGWINYVADGQVVCRGFDLGGVSYVRLIGFEITHTNTSYNRGIMLNGICTHIDILDNYIHDVNSDGLNSQTYANGGRPSNITIRGNTFYYIGRVPNVITNAAIAIGSAAVSPHHWLIEYNSIQKSGDFIDVCGTNNIYRNNYCRDFRNSDFNATDSSWHSDMFQDGSDGLAVGTRFHIYERNFCGDSIEANSHFGIWQDTVGAGDTNIVIRGNVGFNLGESGVGVLSTDHVVCYNNDLYAISVDGTANSTYGSCYAFYKQSTSSDYSLNNMVANCIIHTTSDSVGSPIWIDTGSSATKTHNLGFNTYFDSSFVSTNDPKFIDPSTNKRNFRLQAGSPAIGAGTNVIWVTSAGGTGTSFAVNDSQLLCDGWGLVEGDRITTGGSTTTVTNISLGNNTLYVRDSVTWTNLQSVYWGTDVGPTIGALPYGSTQLTAAAMFQSGSSYTVTTSGDARGVWFYVDGIPTTWISPAPFTANITNGVVTAKAYALYAQANPVVTATNGPSPVSPPSSLHLSPGK
jgi:hypothetical protein